MLTVLASVSAAGVAAAAVPTVRLAVAPAASGSAEGPWVPVARLADLPDGTPVRVRVIADQVDGFTTARQQALGSVWLLRKGGDVSALSATCPHLGCTVDLAPDGKQFFCPCHTSSFDFDGQRAAGKPNKALRGMDPLPTRISASKSVEVQWKRFSPGKEAREVVG